MAPWRAAARWPVLAWLSPRPPVRLLEAAGRQSLWVGGQRQSADAQQLRAARFTALELPEDLVLRRHLQLPSLPDADVREAVALDVRAASPFEPLDLVWAHASRTLPDGRLQVSAAMASRRLVGAFVQERMADLSRGVAPEIWVREGDQVLVLPGFGESARLRQSSRGRWVGYALLSVAVLLAAAAAVTPTVQLKLRAAQAALAFQEVERRSGPLVGQRETLTRINADLEALREQMAEHVDPLLVVDLLTQLVPDDTWLQRLQVQGGRVTLSGQTPNTAALMNTLSRHPGVRDVKAPAPATRAAGGTRENFTLEFLLTPEAMRGQGFTPAVATADATTAATTSTAITTSTTGTNTATTPTANAAAAAPAATPTTATAAPAPAASRPQRPGSAP